MNLFSLNSRRVFSLLLMIFPGTCLVLPLNAGGEEIESVETFRVATYNVYNYLVMDRRIDERWSPAFPKPEEEKTALRAIIRKVNPDVLALQEMGDDPFLRELQQDLQRDGVDYPYRFVLEKENEVRQLAFLSRLKPVAVRGHLDLDFAYRDGREEVKRGLLEVDFAFPDETIWTLYIVHLKSKWTEHADDPEAAIRRTREAESIRNFILDHKDPTNDRFMIAGDVNDLLHSAPLRRLLQRGAVTISTPLPAVDSNGYTWTQRWTRAALYSRIDYLLVSPAMEPHAVPGSARVFNGKGWDVASDHRMVYADFRVSPDRELP